VTTVDAGVGTVEQTLRAVGRDVRRAMLDALPDAEPHRWLYRLVRSYPSRPGKAIRPALCLASCRAFGGNHEDAFPVAVAIEMLHNAFLVHDDIADGSERRRGRPTLSADHGPALALNAGDALVVLANQLLRRHVRGLEPATADRVLHEFDLMALRTLEGQATELGWRHDLVVDVTPEDYLELILYKTCWYTTIHPLRVGLLLGSTSGDPDAMVRFGFYLGAAFQIRDDLLNLTGEEARYGKEINGDLYEGKRSLALIHLCGAVQGSDGEVLQEYLAMDRAERTPKTVARVRALMDTYGSIDFAQEYAGGIADAALDAYADAFDGAEDGPDARFVKELVPYMVGRDR
jgi:geranylgeranyl diphosphate synthase type II